MTDQNPANTPQNRELPEAFTERIWKPGQSGNPNGRPKKKPITEMFERILENTQDLAEIEDAVKAIFKQKSGMAKVLLLEKMAERVEGKVTQPVEANVNVNHTLSARMRKAEQRLLHSKQTSD